MKRAIVIALLASGLAAGGAAYRHLRQSPASADAPSCCSHSLDAADAALPASCPEAPLAVSGAGSGAAAGAAGGHLAAFALEDAKEGEGAPQKEAKQDAPAASAAPAVQKQHPEQDPALGSIEGVVTFTGTPPELPAIEIKADHPDRAKCIHHVKNERLILSEDKKVYGVVLSIAGHKPAQKPKPRKVTLDNKDCAFVPHVQATTVGSELEITNSDPFIHNSRGVLALSFNTAIVPGGKHTEKIRSKVGRGVVSCDFHAWMQANIFVFAHDLFDWTLEDGKYTIANVPPGEHEVEVWHEMLAPRGEKHKVKVESGKATRLDLELKAPAK